MRQIEPSAGVGVAVALGPDLRALLAARGLGHTAGLAAGPATPVATQISTGASAESAGAAPVVRARRARVGVVLCGGNADPISLAQLLATAPPFPKGVLV